MRRPINIADAGQLSTYTRGEREREREREREGERLRLGTRYPNGIDFAIKLINATPVAGNHTLLF